MQKAPVARNSLLPVFVLGASFASAQVTTVDLQAMEKDFAQNSLRAEGSMKGRKVQFNTYVESVDRINGKPRILASIRFFNDNTLVETDIFLAPAGVAAAMQAKPGDQIQVTGLFKSRTVVSKSSVQINTVWDHVQGGTVTTSWPAYRFENATVRIVQTAAARKMQDDARQQREAQREKDRDAAWSKACQHLDVEAAQRAIDLGLSQSSVNLIVEDINGFEEAELADSSILKFYRFVVGKSTLEGKGNAVFASLGLVRGSFRHKYDAILLPKRPKLFRALVEDGLVNLKFKLPDGDNFLLFILKEDAAPADRGTEAQTQVRAKFTTTEVAFVEALAKSGAVGLADEKDASGKSTRDYLREATAEAGESADSLARIRKLVDAMK